MKKISFAGLGASLLFFPAAGFAQSAAPDQQDAARSPQTSNVLGIEEIVVTAQRRNEKLIDVPVTVTVATNEKLESLAIRDLGGLAQIVPGLKVDYTSSWVQPALRGIGSANAGAGVSSPIATYIDNFYVPTANPSGFNFANIENIQVLSGPQGTLFGRNATAGAILITTRGPSDELTFDADASYGRWNTVEGNMFVAGPLGENVGLSLFASGRRSDGFVKNVITGEDANKAKSYSARGKLQIEPSERLRFTLGGEYSYLSDPSTTNFSPYEGRALSVLFFGAPLVNRRGEVANYGLNEAIAKSYAINLTGELDLGEVTLKSFTQYRHDRTHNFLAYDGSALALVYVGYVLTEKTWSQELNFSSNSAGDLSWVAGLFLYKNEGDVPLSLGSAGPNPVLTPAYYGYQKTTTIAPYADATYRIGKLYLTAGIRYSIDTAQKDYTVLATNTLIGTPKATFKEFTPRAIARYEFSDSANVYASYSKGTKPGLYNANSPDTEVARPEKLDAYEVGGKFAGSGWQAEVSAFYYNYRDLQVATYDQGLSYTRNAGKVEIYGGQVHVLGRITNDLTLDAGIAYTHGTYKEFEDVQIYFWPPDAMGNIQANDDVNGRPIQRSPRWIGNVGLTYDVDVGEGRLVLNGNLAYQSKFFFDPNGATEQSGYALLAASAAYTPPGSKFTFSVLGTNLTDKTYLITTLGTPLGFTQIYGEPRSFMFKAAYRY